MHMIICCGFEFEAEIFTSIQNEGGKYINIK